MKWGEVIFVWIVTCVVWDSISFCIDRHPRTFFIPHTTCSLAVAGSLTEARFITSEGGDQMPYVTEKFTTVCT